MPLSKKSKNFTPRLQNYCSKFKNFSSSPLFPPLRTLSTVFPPPTRTPFFSVLPPIAAAHRSPLFPILPFYFSAAAHRSSSSFSFPVSSFLSVFPTSRRTKKPNFPPLQKTLFSLAHTATPQPFTKPLAPPFSLLPFNFSSAAHRSSLAFFFPDFPVSFRFPHLAPHKKAKLSAFAKTLFFLAHTATPQPFTKPPHPFSKQPPYLRSISPQPLTAVIRLNAHLTAQATLHDLPHVATHVSHRRHPLISFRRTQRLRRRPHAKALPFVRKRRRKKTSYFPVFSPVLPLTKARKTRIIYLKSAVYGVRFFVIHVKNTGACVRTDRRGLRSLLKSFIAESLTPFDRAPTCEHAG